MKWIYLLLWTLLMAGETPWRDRKRAAVWLLFGLVGLGLAVWCLWLRTDWRLAEAILR